MDLSSTILLSAQVALGKQTEVIAHNVANSTTATFKREQFDSVLFPAGKGEGNALNLVEGRRDRRDFSPGYLEDTGNVLDLALSGSAFFALETPNGERYTRGGNFTLSADGQIVTSAGDFLLDENGQRISLPTSATDIVISETGVILADGVQNIRLRIVEFADPQHLRSEGRRLYYAGEREPIPSQDYLVHQGFIESSNVEPIHEMTEMIKVTRLYQMVNSAQEAEHERLRTAIRTIIRS